MESKAGARQRRTEIGHLGPQWGNGEEAARLECAQEKQVFGGRGCGVKMKRLRESHWDAGSDLDSGRMLLIQGSGQKLMLGCWWREPEQEMVVSKWDLGAGIT